MRAPWWSRFVARLQAATARPRRSQRRRGPLRWEVLESRLVPAVLTVDTTASSGVGSLASALATAASGDLIHFNIPITDSGYSAGVWTIEPTATLNVNASVTIDATTQPGYTAAGHPVIQLSGINAGTGADGFDLSAANTTIRGLAINQYGRSAIFIVNGGNDLLTGNYLGTDPTGMTAAPIGHIDVIVETADNTIGGTSWAATNIISGGVAGGIQVYGTGATGNVIEGNYFGANAAGSTALANGGQGIELNGGASDNTIGGTAAGSGNLISGNSGNGVTLNDPGTSGNVVEGNYIGLNPQGSAALANVGDGVFIGGGASDNTVGAAGAGNLISGNAQAGIHLDGSGTTGNTIADNNLGANAAGTAALVNGIDLHVSGGATNNPMSGNTQFAAPGTWTELSNSALTFDSKFLLSNGTVMIQGGIANYTAWQQWTPDLYGNYLDGTWTALAASPFAASAYGSAVLPNGNLMIYGGENLNDANYGAIYNPQLNQWQTIASIPSALDPTNQFGDDPLEVLPNGTVLGGYIVGDQTFVYDPAMNLWSAGPAKLDPGVSGHPESSDEETWVKLPGPAGNILDYELWASLGQSPGYGEFLDTSANQWTATGGVPVPLSNPIESELGPALLLADNGEVFQIGANGVQAGPSPTSTNTALYDPSSNTWTAGPILPNGKLADDVPAAELPDGNVLFAVSSSPQQSSKSQGAPPAELDEYNPNAPGAISQLTLPPQLQSELNATYA